jgi:FlaA1/EpsC-like NDP-sugar epimerase
VLNISIPHHWSKHLRLLWKKRLLIVADAVLLAAAFGVSYLLRYAFHIPSKEMGAFYAQVVLVPTVQTLAIAMSGAYRYIWRYIGITELKTFLVAAVAADIPFIALRLLDPGAHNWAVPLSVSGIDLVFGLAAILGARVARRMTYEYRRRRKTPGFTAHGEEAVLLIGAGRVGRSLLGDLRHNRDSKLVVRGFIDDDPGKRGMIIQGVKVVGTTEDLPWLVGELRIDHVIITMMRASRRDLRQIKEICESIPVKLKIVPTLWELAHDRVGVSEVREFDISDLLGREPVSLLGSEVQDAIAGRVVMVTGAGGSIGSELARQIAHCNPGGLLLLDRAEPALFNIKFEIARLYPQIHAIPLLVDVTSRTRLEAIFDRYRPEIVLHAAAHKHVPILESNVCDGVINNVLGTDVLGQLAGEYRAKVMVLISTDKAVRPNSILGATKRAAELVVQHLDQQYQCRYLAVRFGNVIGSAGSVIPVFREQIRSGGPITVSHPEMTRYFMTIPEAAQLVLEAMTMGEGSEIFILDMGDPVKILSLARDLISLCGLRPYEDIDIVFTGPRPGEKITEELAIDPAGLSRTRHRKILIDRIERVYSAGLDARLSEMSRLAHAGDSAQLRRLLGELIPEATLAPELQELSEPRSTALAVGASR